MSTLAPEGTTESFGKSSPSSQANVANTGSGVAGLILTMSRRPLTRKRKGLLEEMRSVGPNNPAKAPKGQHALRCLGFNSICIEEAQGIEVKWLAAYQTGFDVATGPHPQRRGQFFLGFSQKSPEWTSNSLWQYVRN
jgi:hypothetical protein